MEDTVIKCKSEKHGRKIIKYFENLGFYTLGYDGSNVRWYYGVINNKFEAWNRIELNEYPNVKIIKLPKNEKIFSKDDIQARFTRGSNEWFDLSKVSIYTYPHQIVDFRIKPKSKYKKQIKALEKAVAKNGEKVTIKIENI